MAGDRRIKVTGYYTPDDDSAFDARHHTGVSGKGYDEITEQLLELEDIELEAEEG